MGEVWAAEQQIIKTRVAIKLLRAEISTNQQHVQRFFNEAVAVGKIKHAGIVKIFDVGFHEGRAFLIMELLEGETLASRIARAGRLPVGDVADIGRQIASILEATHAEAVTHRDLKPDNVFLTPDAELASKERAKILDFGIAKLGMGITSTGDSMGTPAYMAPEQWNNAAQADARSDVYSLGCVVFEMCCGRPPFVATSIGEAYAKHLNESPPRTASLVPALPRELDDLISQMLAKSAADRPAMRDIGAVLARIAATQPRALDATVAPTSALSPPVALDTKLRGVASSQGASQRTKSKGLLVTGGIVGMIAMASVVAIVATRSSPIEREREVVKPAPADAPAEALAAVPERPKPNAVANAWVRIDPPVAPYTLGVSDKAPPDYVGFRASRGILTSARPYAIQQHEVTWSELDPWLVENDTRVGYPPWATDAGARARLPATGITWSTAAAYCRSLGGALPTEEQWEYAARGPLRRPNPWGADPLDRQMTRAFAGPNAVPSPVMTNQQDQTPRGSDGPIYDLAGNVQEWTLGLWREDMPDEDESFVQRGETTIRAIRGFPLAAPPPAIIQSDSAAYRERLCATGPCVEKSRKLLSYVGFRCAKALDP